MDTKDVGKDDKIILDAEEIGNNGLAFSKAYPDMPVVSIEAFPKYKAKQEDFFRHGVLHASDNPQWKQVIFTKHDEPVRGVVATLDSAIADKFPQFMATIDEAEGTGRFAVVDANYLAGNGAGSKQVDIRVGENLKEFIAEVTGYDAALYMNKNADYMLCYAEGRREVIVPECCLQEAMKNERFREAYVDTMENCWLHSDMSSLDCYNLFYMYQEQVDAQLPDRAVKGLVDWCIDDITEDAGYSDEMRQNVADNLVRYDAQQLDALSNRVTDDDCMYDITELCDGDPFITDMFNTLTKGWTPGTPVSAEAKELATKLLPETCGGTMDLVHELIDPRTKAAAVEKLHVAALAHGKGQQV